MYLFKKDEQLFDHCTWRLVCRAWCDAIPLPPTFLTFLPSGKADFASVPSRCISLVTPDSARLTPDDLLALAAKLSTNPRIESIHLSVDVKIKEWEKASIALAQSLTTNSNLKKLVFSGTMVFSKYVQYFLRALSKNSTIQELNLGTMKLDDETSEILQRHRSIRLFEGMHLRKQDLPLLAKVMRNTRSIQQLEMSAFNANFPYDVLCDDLKLNRSLTHLKFEQNQEDSQGFKVINTCLQHIPTLTALSFSGTVGDASFSEFLTQLEKTTRLKYLRFEEVYLGEVDCNRLSTALAVNRSIQKLKLKDCTMEDARPLERVLTSNTSLQNLNLGVLEMGLAEYAQVFRAIRYSQTLTKLNLKHQISDQEADLFTFAVRDCPSLQSLHARILCNTISMFPCSFAFNQTLRELKLDLIASPDDISAFFKSLELNRALRRAELNVVTVREDSVPALRSMLENNRTIQELKFLNSNFAHETCADQVASAIASALRVNSGLKKFDIRGVKWTWNTINQLAESLVLNSSLESVVIYLGKSTPQAPSRLQQFHGGPCLASFLQTNPKYKDVLARPVVNADYFAEICPCCTLRFNEGM